MTKPEHLNLNKISFRKLNRARLDTLIEWAKAEGWNPGPHDGDVFWETDPDGYYGYFLDDELIAGGSVVSYKNNFGFMGFFIVKPEHRGIGIGRRLWKQRRDLLLSRLNPGASIGMDGVVAMQPFYNKGGFEIAFRDERYERNGEEFKVDPHVATISADDFSGIHHYDRACLGYSRDNFLKPWLNMPQSKSFKYDQNGSIKGFAVLRKADTGFKIGPLFADDPHIAEALYKACLSAFTEEPIYIDIPVIHKSAVDMVEKYQAKYVFECARMYYGTPPKQDIHKIYGITTFELG